MSGVIIILIQVLITKFVFSYPVNNYVFTYAPINDVRFTSLAIQTVPIKSQNFIYYDNFCPLRIFDERTMYYGRRRYPTATVPFTYSPRFPVYSSSYTPFTVFQPSLSNISRLSSFFVTTSPSLPPLSLSTKLVAFSTPEILSRTVRHKDIVININKNKSNVDAETYSICVNKSDATNLVNKDSVVNDTDGKNKVISGGTDTSDNNSNDVGETKPDTKNKAAAESATVIESNTIGKDNVASESKSVIENHTNENAMNENDAVNYNSDEKSDISAGKSDAVSDSNSIINESNAASKFITEGYDTTSESDAPDNSQSANKLNNACETYTVTASNDISEVKGSGTDITSECIPTNSDSVPVPSKVAFKGFIPASGRIRILARF